MAATAPPPAPGMVSLSPALCVASNESHRYSVLVVDIRLGFDAIECRRCGEKRQMGLDCPDCGARAAITEIDHQYQSRKRALVPVKEIRATPGSAPDASPLDMLVSSLLSELTGRISRGANAIARTEQARSDELQQVARDVAGLEAWVRVTRELRPWGAYARSVKRAVDGLVRVFDTTVAMLGVRDGGQAQRLQPKLQQHLDEAADAIWACDALSDRVAELVQSDNPAATWLSLAVGGDLSTASERGFETLRRHGLADEHEDVAFLALVWDCIAGTTSDEQRFWHLVDEHRSLLASHGGALSDVVATDLFAERATESLDDILSAASRALAHGEPESQRQLAAELLEQAHLLVEQPVKLHLGIACAAAGVMSFEETQAAHVSRLVRIAHEQGWAIGPYVSSTAVRNAFGHRDFGVRDGGMVELSPARRRAEGQSPPVMTLDELCDEVLSLVEVCGVMDMAFALVTGRSVEDQGLPASPFIVRTLVAGQLGWEVSELQFGDAEVVLEARCTPPVGFAAVGMLASLVPDCSRLIVRLQVEGGDAYEVEMPVPLFNSWSRAEGEIAKSAAFQVACHFALVNGEPVMTAAQVRKALAMQAAQCLEDLTVSFAEVKGDLASLRDAAKEIGDEELRKAIASGIGWRANVAADHPTEAASLQALLDILGQEVEPFTEWIIEG